MKKKKKKLLVYRIQFKSINLVLLIKPFDPMSQVVPRIRHQTRDNAYRE